MPKRLTLETGKVRSGCASNLGKLGSPPAAANPVLQHLTVSIRFGQAHLLIHRGRRLKSAGLGEGGIQASGVYAGRRFGSQCNYGLSRLCARLQIRILSRWPHDQVGAHDQTRIGARLMVVISRIVVAVTLAIAGLQFVVLIALASILLLLGWSFAVVLWNVFKTVALVI